MAFVYPPAHRSDQHDVYHGREVADPYRWLEDPNAAETKAFVAAQNAVTMPHLDGLPERTALQARMTELWDTSRTDTPIHRAGVTVWAANDGLQDQSVYYVQRPGSEAEVLLDPNTLSDDGAVAVILASLSPDGRYLAYTISEAGSDRQLLRIRSTASGDDLGDQLDHLRFTSVSWYGNGFFYVRWPETDPDSTDPVRDPSVHHHRIGDPQSADPLVFRNAENPELSYITTVTHDDRYLVLIELQGTSSRNGLLFLDLDEHGRALRSGPVPPSAWNRLVDVGVAMHSFLLDDGDGFLIHTDRDAPNGAVVRLPLAEGAEPVTVIPEGPSPIEWTAAMTGELLVARLEEASHRLVRYRPDGTEIGQIDLPGLGSISGLSGRFTDPDLYIGYQSFVQPPTALRWRDGELSLFADAEPPVDPDRVVVERHHATSTDGREVGMFVIRMKGTELPGPVELYGYGGFAINLTPLYSPARLAFLEAGGIVAVANLRGGVELGEAWHEEGMLANKQQVFDDCIACGEHLIEAGVTTAGGLGIRGGSNGGLLTAAVMLQRPDLFGAVVSQVPVTDMLRFQHFTAGRFWTVEYGDAADPDAFEWLIDYSPLHNVGDASGYPPLLITTAESDDRVVPMHAQKFAAEVQYRAGGRSERPLLLRVETRAGHGLGKPTAKVIEESADIYGFLLHHLQP